MALLCLLLLSHNKYNRWFMVTSPPGRLATKIHLATTKSPPVDSPPRVIPYCFGDSSHSNCVALCLSTKYSTLSFRGYLCRVKCVNGGSQTWFNTIQVKLSRPNGIACLRKRKIVLPKSIWMLQSLRGNEAVIVRIEFRNVLKTAKRANWSIEIIIRPRKISY